MRRVIDVTDIARPHAATSSRDRLEEVELVGETARTIRGYSLAVRAVRFDSGGMRIRIELYRDGVYVRHMDLTTELADMGLPLIQRAAELGGPSHSLRGHWWMSCSVQEMRTAIEGMSLLDLERLLGDVNDAMSLATSALELSGGHVADATRKEMIRAKQKMIRRAVHLKQVENAKEESRSLLKHLGEVLRERLGVEETGRIFNEAKRRANEVR